MRQQSAKVGMLKKQLEDVDEHFSGMCSAAA